MKDPSTGEFNPASAFHMKPTEIKKIQIRHRELFKTQIKIFLYVTK
jgi:hypothetical protein